MKKIKEKNDDIFNQVDIIKIEGADYGCNGDYEKVKNQMNLERCVWKLKTDEDEYSKKSIKIFLEDNAWKFANVDDKDLKSIK